MGSSGLLGYRLTAYASTALVTLFFAAAGKFRSAQPRTKAPRNALGMYRCLHREVMQWMII
jgi:hypothetical protein